MRLKKDWEDKIEKTRLKRLRKQDWEERLKNVFINPINLLQSTSIW